MSERESPPEPTEGERPKVRRIDAPPAEPVDMLAVAGGAVAKRVVLPIVALVVVVILIVLIVKG